MPLLSKADRDRALDAMDRILVRARERSLTDIEQREFDALNASILAFDGSSRDERIKQAEQDEIEARDARDRLIASGRRR